MPPTQKPHATVLRCSYEDGREEQLCGRRSVRGLSPMSVSWSVLGETLEVEPVVFTPSQGRQASSSVPGGLFPGASLKARHVKREGNALPVAWWSRLDRGGGLRSVGLPAACLPEGSSAHTHLPGRPADTGRDAKRRKTAAPRALPCVRFWGFPATHSTFPPHSWS